ncbi:MAG: tryptophan 7-halogenase [Polyangiaceae bacterium]|nr:tryptophan 7-halogenase [Polyangiaceae bacterium]
MSAIASSTRVLVIGGGPAGATASTLLARNGFDVTLIEKEIFPRYHIGETLLVSVQPIINLLGAREKADAMQFQKKAGVLWQWGGEEWTFDWTKLNCDFTSSFHVKRERFDEMLLRHAQSQGVKVHEGVSISEIHFKGDRPVSADWHEEGSGEAGRIEFDYLIDTSGRAGIMANKYLKSRRFLKAFQNVAVWAYWKGGKRPETGFEGPLTLVSVPDGWIWYIPIEEDVHSVGLVCHSEAFKESKTKESVEELYQRNLAASPLIADLLKPADKVSAMYVERDYSYSSDRLAGPGYFLSGDAGCFIDPLLSSGVHLAMHSGTMAAACLASVMRGEVSEERATRFYHKCYRAHFVRWAVMVSTFYDVNNKKETAFWRAQTLSKEDLQGAEWTDLKPAFSTLMSGLIDMRDAQDSDLLSQTKSRLDTVLQQIRDNHPAPNDRFYRNGEEKFDWGRRPENAIDGLYCTYEPKLGLVDTGPTERAFAAVESSPAAE